jgi:hypothetical protein
LPEPECYAFNFTDGDSYVHLHGNSHGNSKLYTERGCTGTVGYGNNRTGTQV